MIALFTDFGLYGPVYGSDEVGAPPAPLGQLSRARPLRTGSLARGEPSPGRPCKDGADRRVDWPDDLCEIVYVDHFGNATIGVRAAADPVAICPR
jgi:hypothetical protein